MVLNKKGIVGGSSLTFRRILLFLIVGIFLVNVATAEIQTLGTFKRFDRVDLFQICPNCTYNNISTIIRTGENSFVYPINDTMTKQDTYYNYTFYNTSELGEYIVNGFGDLDGQKTTWNYNFFITETGNTDVSILNNPLIIILISLALIFLIVGIKRGIIWLGFMSSMMFILAGIYMVIYGLNNITNMYTQGIGISIIGVGTIILFVSVFEMFLDND